MSLLQSNYWLGKSISLHYLTAGDPGRPALIFFHGFLGNGYDWYNIITHLSATYYCIAPDLPGHGKSLLDPPERNLKWNDLADNFFEFIGSIAQGEITGTGYSMGGRLMLFLAVTFPSLFERLIVESASPGLKTAADRQERLHRDLLIAERLEHSDLGEFLQDWYHQPLFLSLSKNSSYEELLRRRQKENPAQLAAALRIMSSGIQPSLWPRIENLKMPLLLLAGETDEKYSALLADMQKKCQDAQLKLIRNAGHNTHLENPLVFLEYMSNFLTQTREKC